METANDEAIIGNLNSDSCWPVNCVASHGITFSECAGRFGN